MNTNFIVFLLIFFAARVSASEDLSNIIIHFEDSPLKNTTIHCEDDFNIRPTTNNFEIIEYALMSSESGDRYALITIKNTSSGHRILKQQDLVAILGNCTRKHPNNFEQGFSGGEVFTLKIHFGFSQFPIIQIIN